MKLDFKGSPAAALLTPRRASGEVDQAAFERNVAFVLERGASGVVVAGATGEYPLTSLEERRLMFETGRRLTAGRGLLIAGIGAGRICDTVALGKHAALCGADAALLPSPHFFHYSQDDLEAFYTAAAREIPLPVLIYNLPGYTTGLEAATVLRLIESVPNIAGIKDSSGSLDTLRELTRRPDLGACRLVGHDGALRDAIDTGCCDSAISGIAGVLPELIAGVFDVRQQAASLRRLDQLLPKLDLFPLPWALKLIAQYRGLFEARFPLPVSEKRERQMGEFEAWFRRWWK